MSRRKAGRRGERAPKLKLLLQCSQNDLVMGVWFVFCHSAQDDLDLLRVSVSISESVVMEESERRKEDSIFSLVPYYSLCVGQVLA